MSNPVSEIIEQAPPAGDSSAAYAATPASPPPSPFFTTPSSFPSLASFRPGLYPELSKKPYNERITLWTLETLGFKRSEQAEAAGYLCVIPYSSGGYRSFPARWVAPGELGLLAGLIEEVNTPTTNSLERM